MNLNTAGRFLTNKRKPAKRRYHPMSLKNFLNRLSYSRSCPNGVNSNRWIGMLNWLDARLKEGYSLDSWSNEWVGYLD